MNYFDSTTTASPQAISSGMLRRPPTNLNRQSEDATILLIREVLAKGIELSEACFDNFFFLRVDQNNKIKPVGICRCTGYNDHI